MPDTNPVVDNFGTQRWFDKQGRRHRINQPAVIYTDGCQFYYKHGQIHNTKGPAIIDPVLDEFIYYQNNQLHNLKGPAVINHTTNTKEYWYYGKLVTEEFIDIAYRSTKFKEVVFKFTDNLNDTYYFQNGLIHHPSEPAIVTHTGAKHWYYKGFRVSQSYVLNRQIKKNFYYKDGTQVQLKDKVKVSKSKNLVTNKSQLATVIEIHKKVTVRFKKDRITMDLDMRSITKP